jgi:8-oxo-dGTP pyrophosphatase MutT (NUDIX family)
VILDGRADPYADVITHGSSLIRPVACEDAAVDARLREAASSVVGRDGPEGFEVLVLERGSSSRFLPGYVAFPGGSVDRIDESYAERWFGTASEARRACAIRELVEEVSFVLTARGLGSGDAVEDVDASPPRTDQLPEIAHWIAPDRVPVRFDARYFAVRASAPLEPRPDGSETADAWWVSPERLLEDWRGGRRRLYWPTFFTMHEISACGSVDDLLALRIRTREPTDDELGRLPRSTFWQD